MTTTERAHIAMFSIAAHGHVNPSLEVIRELVARGHRVTYAIPASFAEKVAATGAEPVVYTSTLPTDDEPEAWGAELIDYLEHFLADGMQMLPQLLDAYAGDEPDLVLHDITSYPAPMLAHRWGVPAIQLTPNLVVWDGYEESELAQGFEEMKRTPRGAAYYDRFAAWLAEHDMTHTDPARLVGMPERGIVLIPSALQPHYDKVDTSVFTFVGACQGDRADQGEWHRPAHLDAGTKVVLVSLGSAWTKEPAFYRECLAAFGDLPGWHLVLQIGKFVDPAELGPIPDNVEVHSWVPQLSILRQADAFITHAGAGGSQEGLASGVPMVAVPLATDQFGNAAMLAELGVARHVPMAEAAADTLRTAVRGLVADPEVAAAVHRMRERTAAEGGTEQAADLIEAALPGRAARRG
ncbi:glycosyl transferase [Streptomyces buecherae]|uniref:Glycosyl transferase n=1 Tax=Streptomyces buecherae TaxID=2763006 RepID=A0A7H8NHG2_9ACTN|nr:macrolide family glycosyltransferase [Streptomyces buecherae]QKW52928.1 glycosyl transferase [Streptomyces buecherae]